MTRNIKPFPVFRPGYGATAAKGYMPYEGHRTLRQVDLDEEMAEAMKRDRKRNSYRASGRCEHGILRRDWCKDCFTEEMDITERLR